MFLLLLVVLFRAGTVVRSEEIVSQLTSSLDVPGTLANRLVLDAGMYRFLYLDLRPAAKSGTGHRIAGFSGPGLAAGPLEPSGLFRETASPLGFSAASDVFGESTRLSLAAGMEKVPRRGVWAEVPGGFASLGGFRRDGEGAELAAAFRLGGDAAALSLLVQASSPDAGDPGDDWFPGKPRYLGGPLGNAAVSGSLPFSGGAGGGKGLLRLSAGRSLGERLAGGSFLHVLYTRDSDFAETDFLAGFCESRYAAPTGSFPTRRALIDTKTVLLPEGIFSPRFAASFGWDRQSPLHTAHPPRDAAAAAGWLIRWKEFSLSLDCGRSDERDERERLSAKERAEIEAGWKDKLVTLTVSWAFVRGPSDDRTRILVLDGTVHPEAWEASLRLKWVLGDELRFSGKAGGALKGKGFRLEAGLALERELECTSSGLEALLVDTPKYLVFSLSWTAYHR